MEEQALYVVRILPAEIDKEVLGIINHCYNEATKLLGDNRVILDRISDYLYEKETITGKEFMKMFREMKGIPGNGW